MFGKNKVKRVQRKKGTAQEWIEAILFAFVVAMIIRNYTFQNFKIPSSSMEQTLLIGDYLVANKVKYFFTDPKRGDIVTFRYPADPVEPGLPTIDDPSNHRDDYIKIFPPIYINKKETFSLQHLTFLHLMYYAKKNVVKRVIGMPGDKVEIIDQQVYINDKPLYEPYKIHKYLFHIPAPNEMTTTEKNRYAPWTCKWWGEEKGNKDNFGPVIVPEGKYFVMGDNRDESYDSRFWGFLDRKDITGTPAIVFFSKAEESANRQRLFQLYKPEYRIHEKNRVRWNRFMKIIK